MDKLPYEKIKRKIIYCQDIKLASKPYKWEPEEMFNCGVINLNKPRGWFCRKVTRKLNNLLEISKSGHAGTLDPLVTGVLPVFLQKGTKLTSIVSIAGKRYHGFMKLHKEVSKSEIERARRHFTGKITQLPPKLSAVKRVERVREIYFFNILSIKGRDIEFDVGCQAGTYIRKLCHDFGEYLKVGAHMGVLERTQAGPFKLKDSISFDRVSEKYKKKDYSFLLPVETAAEHLGKVWVDDDVLPRLKHGSPVFAPGIVAMHSEINKGDTVAIMTRKQRLAGIGLAQMTSSQMKKSKKGMAVKTDIVMI